MKKTLIIVILAASVAQPLASIIVVNHDFETGGLADGQFTNQPPAVPAGWSVTPGGPLGGVFYGHLNPLDNAYPGTTGLPGVTGSMTGPNVFYFGDLERGYGLSQILTTNFASHTNYDLIVGWGIRLQPEFAADLRMTLSVEETVLADRTFLADDYQSAHTGTFFDATLSYIWDATHAGLVGKPLTITFYEEGSGLELDIDNVRMTSHAVPEPSSLALLALGAGGLFVRRRRAE